MSGTEWGRDENGCRKLKEICQQVMKTVSSGGLEFFEDVPLGGTNVMFILATDECGFLIDRVKASPVRECHRMVRALEDLGAREPAARCYAVLAVDAGHLPPEDFVLFCKKQNVFFMEYDSIAGLIPGILNMSFSV